VKAQAYHFEIKDLVTQFVAAFDDTVINRYNKDKTIADKIAVRYLYAPKQRVLNDIINKSQHVTLPAVAISIASVSRDESRVFNKIFGQYGAAPDTDTSLPFLPPPVPIDIEVNMSILTKFQTDMDQILSNFIPYTNPYIIVSWKIPVEFSPNMQEIRSEVSWSGTMNLTYPDDLQPTAPYRVTADTTFTIKGWLFPAKPAAVGPRIFYVESNITPVSGFDYI
jgi:hypothetical protein